MTHAEDRTFRTHASQFSRCAMALGVTLLSACGPAPDADRAALDEAAAPSAELAAEQESPAGRRLNEVLGAQGAEVKSRYEARHPKETLMFFGIEPGMTVVEADPSGGWYSGILQSYLGENGTLIGADYPMGVYRLFNYYSDEELAAKESFSETWPAERSADADGRARLAAYAIGSMPTTLDGSADAVVLIRVLHNLADYEEEGAYLTNGLSEVFRVLKPGGVVGIVQHSSPASNSDEWASGANGYLKKSFVMAAMERAGFVFEAESAINENPADVPTEDESVWRLAPTLEDPEDPELAKTYAAIGESNRMTLRFRKPGA